MGKDLAPEQLWKPERAVPQALDLARELSGLLSGHPVEKTEYARRLQGGFEIPIIGAAAHGNDPLVARAQRLARFFGFRAGDFFAGLIVFLGFDVVLDRLALDFACGARAGFVSDA